MTRRELLASYMGLEESLAVTRNSEAWKPLLFRDEYSIEPQVCVPGQKTFLVIVLSYSCASFAFHTSRDDLLVRLRL